METTLLLLIFFFSIILHEIAHGGAALYFGDTTARDLGRLTLDPLKHIDPVMSVIIPFLCVFMNLGFIFGGAKPIPVNTLRLKRPRSDMKWIALAGPATNIGLAFALALLLHLAVLLFGLPESDGSASVVFHAMMKGVLVNLFLAFFNLIPLPPLDGGRIAVGLLPWELGTALARLEPYGMFILVALISLDVTQYVFLPAKALALFLLPI